MKKIVLILTCTLAASAIMAQENTDSVFYRKIEGKKSKSKIDMSNRSNDHLMLQIGMANWSGLPDTINKSGFSKSINLYVMMDFPFKTNPHLSMAFGPGIASDHIVFTKTNVGIKEKSAAIRFTNVGDTNHYKKTKLATVYLEAPIEFRYSSNPLTGNGFKFAIGVKVGTLINAHTRNAKYEDKNNNSLGDFIQKESSKGFFNKNRLSGMARVGYGHFTLFGSHQFTPLFKDGAGPVVRPYSIGLTLSGL